MVPISWRAALWPCCIHRRSVVTHGHADATDTDLHVNPSIHIKRCRGAQSPTMSQESRRALIDEQIGPVNVAARDAESELRHKFATAREDARVGGSSRAWPLFTQGRKDCGRPPPKNGIAQHVARADVRLPVPASRHVDRYVPLLASRAV